MYGHGRVKDGESNVNIHLTQLAKHVFLDRSSIIII